MGDRKGLVDVLSFFSVIRNAYSYYAPDVAHTILERHLSRFGSKSNLILYIDGGPAQEKQDTAKLRKDARDKATNKCIASLEILDAIIKSDDPKPRKRHFTDVKASLASSFYWTSTDRDSFILYMKGAGWSVRLCETEADLAIAVDCRPNDVVISADSDLLAYESVSTLWRPISRLSILEYKLADVCLALEITRKQLAALAIVSHNDYNKNIYSLGPATNYSIIRSIDNQGNTPCKKPIIDVYVQSVNSPFFSFYL